MPYRALLWTIVTVALALLAVGLWVRAVGPMLVEADTAAGVGAGAATQEARSLKPEAGRGAETQNTKRETRNVEGATKPAASTRVAPAGSEVGLRRLVHGTLLLSFVLICMLLVVGIFGAFREWVRFRTLGAGRVRKGVGKTKYVDAWKIAGERMKEGGGGGGDEGTR